MLELLTSAGTVSLTVLYFITFNYMRVLRDEHPDHWLEFEFISSFIVVASAVGAAMGYCYIHVTNSPFQALMHVVLGYLLGLFFLFCLEGYVQRSPRRRR